MKKNVLIVFTIAMGFLLLLGGCGSTSNTHTDSSNVQSTGTDVAVMSATEIQKNYITVSNYGKEFSLSLPLQRRLEMISV